MKKCKGLPALCLIIAMLLSACAGTVDTSTTVDSAANNATTTIEATETVDATTTVNATTAEDTTAAAETTAAASSTTAGTTTVSASIAEDSDEITTMTVFINHTWYWTDRFEGIIPDALLEKTGVRLEPTRAVDDNQLGLMIASGDLLDLIFTSTELDRLSDSRLSYPYNELIAQYTPDWTPDSMRVNIAKAISGADDYYFLRNNFNPASEWAQYPGLPMVGTLAYRGDIIDKLGNPPMNTIDDYISVLGLVKNQYPDMIPLATSITRGWRMMPFRVWLGVGNSEFIEMEDGSVIYFMNHPNYKEFCQLINSFYLQGFINADNFSITESDTKTLVTNSQCFSFTGYSQGEMYRFGEMAKNVDPDAYVLESKPLDNKGKYYVSGTGWSGTVITRSNPAPDKAIKMMQYLFSDEGQRLSQWGREGIEWTMGSDGYPIFSDEWLEASTDDNVFYTKYNPAFYFGTSAAVESTGRTAVLPEDYRAVYNEFKPMMEYNPWIGHALPTGDIEERNILTRLTDLWENFEVRVFLSASSDEFERNFNEYIANANQIGVSALEAYMTEEVKNAKPLFQ